MYFSEYILGDFIYVTQELELKPVRDYNFIIILLANLLVKIRLRGIFLIGYPNFKNELKPAKLFCIMLLNTSVLFILISIF